MITFPDPSRALFGSATSVRPDAGAGPISGREESPRPVVGTARVPPKYSIFDRFYKVFRLGESHVPSRVNETVL